MVEDGLLKRGVLIRHLILPGRLEEAKAVMDWIAEQFPPGAVLFSLMGQYVPWGRAAEFPEIDRRLRRPRRAVPRRTWLSSAWRALRRTRARRKRNSSHPLT